ncbi:hypothetical protein ABMA27_011331 [Loxostege sticticalis]|uniref:Tower domain-containing protein n=1 Tax=Loxostege sticticalis TaxID=481309 RepID=A0ABR3H2W5_LOXSC
MDDTTNVIENFEEILKQNAKKQPLALYRDQNSRKEPSFQGQRLHSVKDVISKVAIQIKAIQKADVPNTSRQDRKKLDKYKRSSFVPVNMLPSDVEVPIKLPATKFETQCVSDTQLIHIIDNAEALADNNGITQEFDSTFSQTDVEKDAWVDKNYATCIENNAIHENDSPTVSNADIELNNKNTSNSKMPRKANKNSNTETKIVTTEKVENHNFVTKSNENKAFVNCDKDITQIDTQLNNNCTEMLDKCIEIETNLNVLHSEELDDDEIQPSLVFEAKKSKSPSPLVFDLETFEDFEKIAAPIIEENPDLKSAKQLINSQIIGKELFIQTDIPCEVSQIKEQLSPVLQISAERLKITNTDHTNMDLKDHNYKDRNPIERNESDDTFLKDEILFSSDEENEYLHKEFQDIPLTCALETSFYEQPDMLDKTMYVGFQTASNRSIQISTESFCKAQSILDDLEKDVSSKATLTDLVESLSVKHDMSNSLQSKMNPLAKGIRFNTKDPANVNLVEEEIDHLKRPDKRKFEGFKTVSRKKIKLSDMALARCKRVFRDIDLDDNYDTKIESEINGSPPEENVTVDFYTGSKENEVKTGVDTRFESNQQIDDDILQEFANDMSLITDDNQNTESANFETASNKDFQIPDPDVLTTRKFFNTIDFSDSILENNATSEIANKKSSSQKNENMHKVFSLKTTCNSSPEIIGFKTASNNQIKISSKALEKAKSLFQEINVCEEGEPNLNPGLEDVEDFNQPATSKDFGGFKTASNKDIKISSEVRSKNILQDIITNVCEDDLMNKPTNKEQARGFETANSKDIEMSKDAYGTLNNNDEIKKICVNQTDIDIDCHAKDFDDDLNEVFNTELLDIEKEQISEPCGFKTASNKPVNISEKALAHSKNLFKDLGVDDDLNSDYEKNMGAVPVMLMKSMTVVDMKKSVAELFVNKSTDIKPFGGFQTANNKAIKVSAKALAQSKALFKDIDNDNNFNININNKERIKPSYPTVNKTSVQILPYDSDSKDLFEDIDKDTETSNLNNDKQNKFVGFQTASKKPVEISAQALAKSKAIFKDIDDEQHIIIKNDNTNVDNISTFKGFQIASNKTVKISTEALAKSKAIFQDIDKGFDAIEYCNKNTNTDIPKFAGFQTASKKPVIISAEALSKSKALFKDIDKDIDAFEENNDKNPSSKEFKGFQTASKIPVQISEEALAKSKALFKDIKEAVIEENDTVTKKQNVPKFMGFQTASKKPVQVSDEALARSKALFKDIEEAVIEENDIVTKKQNVPKFMGFHTASKKPVQVSDEALAKSKALFKDIDERDIVEQYGKTNKDDMLKFQGFQTASRKPVEISNESLARSKALFKDIDHEGIVEKDSSTGEPKFRGFETAYKKPVQVSEEALAKSKALFKDFDGDIVFERNPTMSNKFLGFQTASNKSVKVSEEALARSKRIFDEIDGFQENNAINNKLSPFKGFETASKKKVKISEDALKKTRQIFQDIDIKYDDCKENLEDTFRDTKKLHFKRGNNKEITVSENSLKDSRQLLTDLHTPQNNKEISKKYGRVFKEDNNIDKLIDTQVINNFEQTLYSEDFSKETTPKKSKRSGSPILSCPRAKRRKFNTPYRNDSKTPTVDAKITPKHEDTLLFNKDYKKNKRYTLKNLAKVEETNKKLKPDPYILNFNMDNLLDFEFVGQRNDMTDGKFSIEDLKEYFLKMVNKKLVPIGWLDIHLKWILWKLISYEVKFTQTLNKVCTVKNVIEQLKFRYDKELYNVERPVLRKILEKDDAASKTMVLCVAGIFVDGVNVSSVTNISSNVELLLTDGWYCVKAVIDKMLAKLVYDEKITVGCKIVTNGAELMNCEQGVSPWEDTSSVRLKIYGNSTRRARWDARLGCHSNGAILTALSSVKPEGGKVSKLRLYVTRVYPMLYVEKFEDGSTVTRSERLENIHQIKYEADRQTTMEKLYEEVEKELSDQESQDSEASQLKIRKHSGSMITESQTKCLVDKSNRQREKLLQNIEERVRKKIEEKGLNVGRNVVTLLKIRVAGVEDKDSGVVVTKGFMSIWKPNDMLTEIIKEDSWIEVMNVVPTAIRYSEIHLSAGRQTVFNQSKFKESNKVKPYLKAMVRKCYPVGELSQNPTMTTDYNEIDTVGFIFQIDDESSKQPFQNMYLSDGERNIICVNFWGGLKKFGFQNVLDTGQIVSCTNLQKRAGNTRKSIPQFRVTEFTFFTKTPKNLVARNMIVEIEKKISSLDKRKYCEECVKQKNNYSNKCLTENVSPYRFNDLNLTKNKMFIDSPLVAKREDNLNLTGLDFESSFRQTQELSPKSKERKRKVNEKIARLKMIGEPPPISPISIINKSKRAFNSYKSPLAQTSVATAEKSVEISKNDIQSSPIIPMNRTYVKNVNPVKLNFSNVQDNSLDEVDHFAEEFDGSPPLSLE